MKIRLPISMEAAFILENPKMIIAFKNTSNPNIINQTILDLLELSKTCNELVKYLRV